MPERPDLVVFDCDGVLVDSEHLAAPVLAAALGRLGWQLTPEEADERFRGRSLTDCLRLAETELGAPLPESFLPELEAATARVFEAELAPVPGVGPVLEALRAAGLGLCVASSGSHQKIRHSLSLTGLAGYFGDRIFSASDVAQGKPAPDVFLYAMRRMGHAPERTAVVEDSLPGVRAGLASGARVLAYAPGGADPALRELGATVLTRMDQLPRLLGLP